MGHVNDIGAAISGAAQDAEAGLVALRRDLHAHPELAFEEVRTAGVIAGELARLGIAHRTGVGRTAWSGLSRVAGLGRSWPSAATWTPCRSRSAPGSPLPAPAQA